jgi:tRNA-dihydrouridine synthase B
VHSYGITYSSIIHQDSIDFPVRIPHTCTTMKIGTIELDSPIALAPMEDVTDLPFRLICKRLGADLLYTEFASSEALIRDARLTLKKIEVSEEERPVGVQIFGSLQDSMERAATIAEKANPDFIDINCGCWVKKVALRNAGAGLLKDLSLFEAIVKSTIRGTSLPVTVKTRLGWDKDSINIIDVAKMVEQAGVTALTVHCRTRSQGQRGQADWSWLEKIKSAVSIPIIGNGDVINPEDAKRMFETGCDGVMIGRGAQANPWIFQQARHYIQTSEHLPPPTMKEKIDTCLSHLDLSLEWKGERYGIIEFRKYYSGYLKATKGAAKLRAQLVTMTDIETIKELLRRYLDGY